MAKNNKSNKKAALKAAKEVAKSEIVKKVAVETKVIEKTTENVAVSLGSEDEESNELELEKGSQDEELIEEAEVEEDSDEEELVPLEDIQELSVDEDDDEEAEPIIHEDAIPIQRVLINNKEGLLRVLDSFRLKGLPWVETQTITSSKPLEIEDVHNDLDRELGFFEQALAAAEEAKQKCIEFGIPFTRPDDYFAEMVKSDEHMNKIRQKILDESQGIKASEDARKQRDLKKFGKQVQVEKIKERHLQKRQELDKIKNLKRKLKDTDNADDFAIDLEDDFESEKPKKSNGKAVNHKRNSKDSKYGFGGKKRHAKSNTRESTYAEKDGFSVKKNKASFGSGKSSGKPTGKPAGKAAGKASRPGKNKRNKSR